MAYQEHFNNKKEFYLSRLSMHLGSIANLYSGTPNPPSPQKIYEEAVELTDKVWLAANQDSFDPFPELDEKLKQRFKEEQREKKIGRYSASELWGLLNKKIPPENYLEPRVFTEEEMRRMYWGVIVHEGIQKLFGGFEEKKYVIQVDKDIELVCKIDLEIGNEIFEFKTRETIDDFQELPSWYLYQSLCYLEAKNLEEMKLYLLGWGFSRRLFIVKRNKVLFESLMAKLKIYHENVKKAYSK